MSGQSSEAQWYIARDGKQHGPLTDVEMRTFVAHSYLRPSDLLWRPGMNDWLPAPSIFPALFQSQPAPGPGPAASTAGHQAATQAAQQAAARAAGAAQQPAHGAQPNPGQPGGAFPGSGAFPQPGGTSGAQPYAQAQAQAEPNAFDDEAPRGGLGKKLAIAAVLTALIGGGAFAIVQYREPLMRIVSGPPKKASQAAPAPAVATPGADTKTAAVVPSEATPPEPADPAVIEGSQIDARLQKIPVWEMLKKDYPDWYIGNIAAAEKLSSEKKSDTDIATQLVQGLVSLRRQNAEKALAASPEKLKGLATAFLENLRALQTQSVGACYGFISKGEMSPGVVEQMRSPETATALNAHLAAIFSAAEDGAKSPVKHESAVKADYDVLIGELNKLGWKEEDLQTFSNPRLLAKREPAQVCKMVQDWFVAHLAVPDTAAQDRLLFETLKPVVSG